MKKHSENSQELNIVQKIVGLGENSIQKSYYPKLQEKINELEIEKEKYLSIFNNAINGIFRIDFEGFVYEANPAFAKILGYDSPDDVKNKLNIKELLMENSINWKKIIEELILKSYIYHYQLEIKRKDHATRWLSVNLSITGNNEKFIEGFAEDISEKKGMEERLFHSQKMDAIGQLAGGVAHDFNNMLSGILGAADMLEKHVDVIGKSYLDVIVQASERAADLVSKLLTFGRKTKPDLVSLNINKVIDNSVAILERSINKKIVIDRKFIAGHSFVKGDESQLQNIFINMGINAGHAMPNGGSLVFTTSNVIIGENLHNYDPDVSPGEYVEITVTDTGTGIDSRNIDKIFEPFFTTKEIGKGTGLGLSAVYGIVKEHKGAIYVNSKLGEGTSFNIYFPVVEAVNKSENYVETASLNGGVVLVADDEEINLTIINAILEDLNFKVFSASNGKDALELFKKHIDDIDVVFLDMFMPKMDGKETFRQIRSLKSDAKVVIASGLVKDDKDNDLVNEGVSGYLYKPFRKNEIARLLFDLLN